MKGLSVWVQSRQDPCPNDDDDDDEMSPEGFVQHADTAVYAAAYLPALTRHRQRRLQSPRTRIVVAVDDVLPGGQATLSGHSMTAHAPSVSVCVPCRTRIITIMENLDTSLYISRKDNTRGLASIQMTER